MDISKKDKWSVIYHCYLAYFLSGMVILIFGVILPYLIEERGINFTVAGGMLSFLAIGNLLASVVYPLFCAKLSQKKATVLLAVIYPVCLFLFSMPVSVTVLYVMVFLIGITKGTITIINNHAIRQVTASSNKYLNLLHMWYAVGALLSPFLTSMLTAMGMDWKVILQILAAATICLVLTYQTMDFSRLETKADEQKQGADVSEKEKESFWFLKNASFLLAAGILFSYLGLENSVNGWFVTYLKSTGLMSMEVSTIMVSVTWVMIMIGRIVIASVSKNVPSAKILAVISVVQFMAIIMLVRAASPAMVVAALVIMGLGMAGTFPTATAFTGSILGSSPVGMSVLTGIGSLGGILTPQIIGVLADHMGFGAAILFLVIDGLLLVVCGILTMPASIRRNS